MEAVQLSYIEAAGGFEAAVAGADGFGKTPAEAFEALALKLDSNKPAEETSPATAEVVPAAEVAASPFPADTPSAPPTAEAPTPPEVTAEWQQGS